MSYAQILEDLKNGVIKEFHIGKEEFLDFRSVLIKHPEFKNFRGNAQKGGSVIYTYEPNWSK